MPIVKILQQVPINIHVYCKICNKPLDIVMLVNPEEHQIFIGVTPGHKCKLLNPIDMTKSNQVTQLKH